MKFLLILTFQVSIFKLALVNSIFHIILALESASIFSSIFYLVFANSFSSCVVFLWILVISVLEGVLLLVFIFSMMSSIGPFSVLASSLVKS